MEQSSYGLLLNLCALPNRLPHNPTVMNHTMDTATIVRPPLGNPQWLREPGGTTLRFKLTALIDNNENDGSCTVRAATPQSTASLLASLPNIVKELEGRLLGDNSKPSRQLAAMQEALHRSFTTAAEEWWQSLSGPSVYTKTYRTIAERDRVKASDMQKTTESEKTERTELTVISVARSETSRNLPKTKKGKKSMKSSPDALTISVAIEGLRYHEYALQGSTYSFVRPSVKTIDICTAGCFLSPTGGDGFQLSRAPCKSSAPMIRTLQAVLNIALRKTRAGPNDTLLSGPLSLAAIDTLERELINYVSNKVQGGEDEKTQMIDAEARESSNDHRLELYFLDRVHQRDPAIYSQRAICSSQVPEPPLLTWYDIPQFTTQRDTVMMSFAGCFTGASPAASNRSADCLPNADLLKAAVKSAVGALNVELKAYKLTSRSIESVPHGWVAQMILSGIGRYVYRAARPDDLHTVDDLMSNTQQEKDAQGFIGTTATSEDTKLSLSRSPALKVKMEAAHWRKLSPRAEKEMVQFALETGLDYEITRS